MPEIHAEVTCGTALVLRYEIRPTPSASKHALGCPECQSGANILPALHQLQMEPPRLSASPGLVQENGDWHFIRHAFADCERSTALDQGRINVIPEYKEPESGAKPDLRTLLEIAEDEAKQRKEDNRNTEDAINDFEEDARHDDEGNAAASKTLVVMLD